MNSWLIVWIWCMLDPNLIEILYNSLVCLQLYKIERSDGRKEERAFEETQEGRNWMVAVTWQPLVWCCCGNCRVTCVCNAVGLQLQWACWERMEKRESKWHTRHTAARPGPACTRERKFPKLLLGSILLICHTPIYELNGSSKAHLIKLAWDKGKTPHSIKYKHENKNLYFKST